MIYDEIQTLLNSQGIIIDKTHPRIIFRGLLDDLHANVRMFEIDIRRGTPIRPLISQLEDIASEIKLLIRDEATNTPRLITDVESIDFNELRDISMLSKVDFQRRFGIRHATDLSYNQYAIAVLDSIRTNIRKVEISAIQAYEYKNNDTNLPKEMIINLNRLSLFAYILRRYWELS